MLTNKQRNFLRKAAHGIEPIFRIGKSGLSDSMIEQMNLAFEAREIFKVYVLNNSELDVREVCDEIVRRTCSEPVSVVGNKFVLYKPSSVKPKLSADPIMK